MTRSISLALLLVVAAPFSALAESRPPNIVFIFIDDMGYADPSCFGNPHVKTPHIDGLARDGIKLTNFYVNSPICSPSRVAVTTGQYPARWKIHSYLNTRAGNRSRGMRDFLDAAAPTTAKKLKAAGYATAHFGKWHMGGGRDVGDAPLPQAYGFDESLVAFEGLGDRLLGNPKNSSVKLGRGKISFCNRWEKTEKYTDRAIDFIRRNKDKPFYVRLFPNDVHDAHVPWPGTDEKWKSVTDNHWEQKFFAVLEEMDKQIGRLIGEIDKLGLGENTLILFTSDNGPTDWPKYYRQAGGSPPGFTGPFFGRKWSLFEGGIRMPFIARWKGKIPAGVTDTESVMSGIDLSPTFCKFAGVDVPASERLDGIDRSAVLLGKPSPRARPIFWQYGAPHAVLKAGKVEFQSPSFAIRDGAWKLLVNPDGSEARLFDLTKDPGEKTNLLEREPARAADLFGKIKTWAKKTDFDFDDDAKPVKPAPTVAAVVNNQLLRFNNHGVKIGDDGAWDFDGKSWLSLPKHAAPKVSGKKWIRINATIDPAAPNGVILAHGGDRSGYCVYLKDGKLTFATAVDWKRTVINADTPLGDGAHAIEAFWRVDGTMTLQVDKKLVAKGKAPGSLKSQPGDSIEIGADLIKPVGDYQGTNTFRGTISGLTLRHPR
jgi:arylsulfatase A-like enzyme